VHRWAGLFKSPKTINAKALVAKAVKAVASFGVADNYVAVRMAA